MDFVGRAIPQLKKLIYPLTCIGNVTNVTAAELLKLSTPRQDGGHKDEMFSKNGIMVAV